MPLSLALLKLFILHVPEAYVIRTQHPGSHPSRSNENIHVVHGMAWTVSCLSRCFLMFRWFVIDGKTCFEIVADPLKSSSTDINMPQNGLNHLATRHKHVNHCKSLFGCFYRCIITHYFKKISCVQ